jgi:predicted AAA+ superfamily ATPase
MKSREIKSTIINKHGSPLGRILVLTGARQTGKTTLARRCFPNYTYLSIEDPVLRLEYASLTASQWKTFYLTAILDEIQKEPQLIESIKSVYDQYSDARYVMLGSSQLLLLQKVRESLAGRCYIQEVFPLTLPEIITERWDEEVKLSFFQQYLTSGEIPGLLPSFLLDPSFANKKQAFDYYLPYGGYPAIVGNDYSNDDRFDWLTGYVKTYLERDVRDLADFKSLEPFVKIQKVTSLLTGQLVNFANLGKEAGVSPKTAQRFIHYLELSYQTILLTPWYKNTLKRMSKSPKLHYLDPGVQRAIIQKKGEVTGNEFESAVISEIYKQVRNARLPVTFHHLRTLDGREIDLLLETERGYIPIEIKITSRVGKSDAKHFSGLSAILDKPILKAFILSLDPSIYYVNDGVMAVPAAMFLT